MITSWTFVNKLLHIGYIVGCPVLKGGYPAVAHFGCGCKMTTYRSGRFGLANSVWPFRSEPFRSGRFDHRLFGLGRFGLETFRSDYEILLTCSRFT